MNQWKRVVALILAIVLSIYGLPAAPTAQAAFTAISEGEPTGETPVTDDPTAEGNDPLGSAATVPTMPTTAMRFVQTGFDNDTGVLTMSLQIRPNPADGQLLREGFFLFQVDGSKVIPITHPRAGSEGIRDTVKEFRTYSDKIAAAVTVNDTDTTTAIKEFSESEQYVSMTNSNNFSLAMNATGILAKYTGFMVSEARKQAGETEMLDCYYQFYIDPPTAEQYTADEDGYVTVQSFDFQCYDINGDKATSEDVLSAASIKVPDPTNITEINKILQQFSYIKSGDITETKIPLAMGTAGFIQQYKNNGIYAEGKGYYYTEVEPTLTTWRKGTTTRSSWAKNSNAITAYAATETSPGIYYTNMDREYIVESLDVGYRNTFAGDFIGAGQLVTNPDFKLPTDSTGTAIESGRYARYSIPSYTQSEQNDQAENWLPEAYQLTGNRVKLKYYAAARVTADSLTSPDKKDFEKFFDSLKWYFALKDGTSLEDIDVTETGESFEVPTADSETYTVKPATVTDESYSTASWFGTEIWNVYKNGEYFMRTPVGITFDMLLSDVSYLGDDDNEQTRTDLKAPQLHVTYEAAERSSIIWNTAAASSTAGGEKTVFAIYAVYEENNIEYKSESIEIGLYKGDSTPGTIDVLTGSLLGEVYNSDDELQSEQGFYIGNTALDGSGTVSSEDAISQGVDIRVVLCDQYHVGYADKFPTVTLEPTPETQAKYTAAGKSNPFTVSRSTGNTYTIKYKDKNNVNEAVEGTYVLKATYTEPSTGKKIDADAITLYISKPKDKFSFMRTSLSTKYTETDKTTTEDGTTYDITYQVPAKLDNRNVTVSEHINILELANQWRNKTTNPDVLSRYDMAANMRDSNGTTINLTKARENGGFDIIYEIVSSESLPDGIDVSKLSSGDFSFNSSTPDGAEFSLKITAQKGGYSQYVQYNFTFARYQRLLKQINIYPPKNQATIVLRVPLKTQADTTLEVDVQPFDQYGTSWTWSGVEAAYQAGGYNNPSGQSPYSPWALYADGNLPTGVTMSGDNNKKITVSSSAKNSTFRIYAQFSGLKSSYVTVEIKRDASVPTTVSTPVYYYNSDTNRVKAPTKDGLAEINLTPTVVLEDQYDELITDCTQKWYSNITSEDPNVNSFVSVDPATGKITVKKCAPVCTITTWVRFTDAKGNSKTSAKCQVQVVRDANLPDSVTIKSGQTLNYPAKNSEADPLNYLKAEIKNQYNETVTVTGSELTWTLDEVSFTDGTVLKRTEQVSNGTGGFTEVVTGQIPESGGTYSADGMVNMTTAGVVSFGSTTQAGKIPTSFKVTVKTTTGITDTATIPVSKEQSYPDVLYFPSEDVYTKGVQLPEAGNTVDVPLLVYVMDQFGIVMESQEVVWSHEYTAANMPAGVRIDLANKKVTIDHLADPNTSIAITATCRSNIPNPPSGTLYLNIKQENPTRPESIELGTNMTNSAGETFAVSNDSATIYLPSQTGVGYENYNASAKVRDQFRRLISRNVEWTVESQDTGVSVQVLEKATGKLRVYYTADALEALKRDENIGFTLRVTADTTTDEDALNGGKVYKDMRVKLDLADSTPTYATPYIKNDSGNLSDTGKPIVPGKSENANRISIGIHVYDQYGRLLSDKKGTAKLITIGTGLAYSQPAGATGGTLSIESTVTGLSVTLLATPEGMPNAVRQESYLNITLDKATAAPYELALDATNVSEFDIPTWSSSQVSNVPGVDTVDTVTLGARVLDQYGAAMAVQATDKPVWSFIGEHDGIEFSTGGETAEGQEVILNVSNRSVPAGKLSSTIKLQVTVAQFADAKFTKTVELTLKRNQGVATYMFITGADEDGVDNTNPAKRPYAEDKTYVYQFDPVVYDQYGTPIETNEILMDMDDERLTDSGFEVEKLFDKGKSEEKGDAPIGYKVYRVVYSSPEDETGTKTLLAEFDCNTGKLTVYTECYDIASFALTATYPPLNGYGTKNLVVPVTQERIRAYTAKINRGQNVFAVRNGDTEPIYEYVNASVYDQYGKPFTGAATITWSLLLDEKDENDQYVAYKSEKDADGAERRPSDFLVQKTDSRDGSTTLMVKTESFFEPKTLILRCQVVDHNSISNQSEWVYEYSRIVVRRPATGSAHTIVTFDAGKYGKLVGASSVEIESGGAPAVAPGVKNVEGYAFIGWTSDGVIVVDATKVVVYDSTTYTAVYKDITGTKFLEGYEDNTVRPESNVTRAEFLTMVVRAIGGYDSSKNYGSSFKDVLPDSWYANIVAYAKQMGLINGYIDGTFKPEEYITRAEAAKILVGAAQLKANSYGTFTDVEDGKWYSEYIEALYEANVINGYEDGTFKPNKLISRAEAVKMTVMITKNALNDFERDNIQKYAYCGFKDIRKTHWAYPYILRAAGMA